MKIEAVLATTHVDLQHQQFTLNALKQMNDIINGETKPLVTYEHDLAIPPAGKVLESRVERRNDGEFQLVATQELFQKVDWQILEDGTKVFKQECEIDRHPFTNKYEKVSEGFALSVDLVNFESPTAMQSFLKEIREHSEADFETGTHGRKSLIPDPEVIVQISSVIAAYLFSKKVIDKVGDNVAELVAEDVTRFYSFVRSVAFAAAKYAIPRHRPITYIFVLANDPSIEFTARSSDTNLVVTSILLEKLESALSNARYLQKTFRAVKIQYLLSETGEWEFNYLLTDSGGVVGTCASLARRSRRIELMSREVEETNDDDLPAEI